MRLCHPDAWSRPASGKSEETMRKCAIGGALALFLVSVANGAVLLGDYKAPKNYDDRAFSDAYLRGVMDGLTQANVALAIEGKPQLFCLPPNLAITAAQAEDIMLREAKQTTAPDSADISLLLYFGLEETFPCGEKGTTKWSPMGEAAGSVAH
jgi:Rap1a immunity proteins